MEASRGHLRHARRRAGRLAAQGTRATGGCPEIGFLGSSSAAEWQPLVQALQAGLKETGYVAGENVDIEYRWADGHYERLPALAGELVHQHVAVIVAAGSPAPAQAAKAATSTIPIVFALGIDPVQFGLVASLNRPGGNVTGVNFLSAGLVDKTFGLMHELLPHVTVAGMLLNRNNPNSAAIESAAHEAARSLGLNLHLLNAGTDAEIERVFAEMAAAKIGFLAAGADPYLLSRREHLVALAARHALPVIFFFREFVAAGGLMSYGTNINDAYRRAGIYTGKILKGARPADLPIEQSTRFELVINLNTAKILGL
ncbi:MAG: ABC transporter substrate-binding protein, partial [Xanthobacteraceae bacterium]